MEIYVPLEILRNVALFDLTFQISEIFRHFSLVLVACGCF